jgi:glycerol-3-phosphate dehydrogenase
MVSDTETRFGPDTRERALERCESESFDVLVVGGGVTGCGAALDAASRGLSVALVEKRDFAAGTSSRSSKLIHGGLRYLESFDVELVREALHESLIWFIPRPSCSLSSTGPGSASTWARASLSTTLSRVCTPRCRATGT